MVGVHHVVHRSVVTLESRPAKQQAVSVVAQDPVPDGDGERRPVGGQVHRRGAMAGDERVTAEANKLPDATSYTRIGRSPRVAT